MSASSPLVRMIPLQLAELPVHHLLTSTDSEAVKRPDLLPFVFTLLEGATSTLNPTAFNLTFKSHSHKPSPPSNNNVEALTASIQSSTISQINWQDPSTTGGMGRARPREIPTEHWFARRSYHKNISSKQNPATASWEEFVFGLRDNHSRNEMEFTPTLYDARHILDWNTELRDVEQQWKTGERQSEGPGKTSFNHITLAVYEMCHEIPFPLQPRCFPVLVATASVNDREFVAVTVPVNLSSFPGAFYSTERNRTEGEDQMRKKQVVLGIYTAVERCVLMEREEEVESPGGDGQKQLKKEEFTEWIMATASDAKGNLPMLLQRNSMPGAVVKDVGYFLKWIHEVDDAVVKGEKQYESARSSGEDGRRRSRGASSASREMLSSARSSIEKATSLAPP